MHTREKFYPPSLATLSVRDLSVSSRWYQQVMGFKVVFERYDTEGQLTLAHLRWTKYTKLMLVPNGLVSDRTKPKGVGMMLTFMVSDSTLDELAKAAKADGADILTDLVVRPWGTREVVIADPDGYRLSFCQQADAFPEYNLRESLQAIVPSYSSL